MRRIIRTNGTEEVLDKPLRIADVEKAIGATTLDTVNLGRGLVMLVDDLGHMKKRPINFTATHLYNRNRRGLEWQIRGDVVIAPDLDFEEEAAWA